MRGFTRTTWLFGMIAAGLVAPVSVSLSSPAPAAQAPLAAAVERRLHSDNIDASTFLWNDWNKFVENYHPNYVADDDPATAWVEGAKGSGSGEWLRIQVTPLDATTRIRLHVRNGYQKSGDLFRANARAREVTLRLLPSRVEKQVTLADKDGWQDVAIEQPSGVVRAVEIAVRSVYDGTKYEDLCISDVQVFATSRTPDNPAFEKSKHQALMSWRAARLAAAKLFKGQKVQLPLYPAYAITAMEVKVDEWSLTGMIDAAAADPIFAKDWKAQLEIARATAGNLDALPRAQIAPVSQERLVAADGLQIPGVADIVGPGGDGGFYDEDALRLPMLDYVSTMFADQLRMLDVKDKKKVGEFLADDARCTADVTWASRAAPKEGDGPARVVALVVGRCAKVPARAGSFNARAIELYVYDAAGRLALVVADGHIDGYRWATDNGRAMLTGGHALLAQGKRIDAKRREAVAAN